jgi:SOS response associated peptidase (SRAP)
VPSLPPCWRIDRGDIVSPGDHAAHADCCLRQALALQQVREQERARNAEAGVAKGVVMCGRFTVKMTWAEIVALYKLTLDRPPHNLPPRYNVCPTDPIDVVTEQDGKCDLVRVRWGLAPRWWVARSWGAA